MRTGHLSLGAYLHDIADRAFGEPEEINGGNRCPTYLFRWHLFAVGPVKVYLHRFIGEDWSLDLHDHPKRFVSIGLLGRYIEYTKDGERLYRAPWFRTFAPEHSHRIATLWQLRKKGQLVVRDGREECWTLVLVGPTQREWGFWRDGLHYHWNAYVRTSIGDARVACR